jgi:hypothetical protein
VLIPIGFLAKTLRVQPERVLHVGAHKAEEIDLGLIHKSKNWISEKYYLTRAYRGTKIREFVGVNYENNA